MDSNVYDNDAGFPSFTDVIPFAIQEKVLGLLTWDESGGAASTCKAWRAHFQANLEPSTVTPLSETLKP